ncbi:MAG: hypothetical protein D6781_00485 [Verrucomicrobia bacterium]|nr:MAG: hypothetical protein D6781_00485 [Verrucomicrobiota bacterium]
MNPWDLAALIPIIRGAGGITTDWQGRDPLGADSASHRPPAAARAARPPVSPALPPRRPAAKNAARPWA